MKHMSPYVVLTNGNVVIGDEVHDVDEFTKGQWDMIGSSIAENLAGGALFIIVNGVPRVFPAHQISEVTFVRVDHDE